MITAAPRTRTPFCAGHVGRSGQTVHVPRHVVLRNRDRLWWRIRRGVYRTVLIYSAL